MLKGIQLRFGKSKYPFDDQGNARMCAMEYAAYLAGEIHTDDPPCVSEALRPIMRRINDNLPDEDRQRLKPFIVRSLGTAGDLQDAQRYQIWHDSRCLPERFSCHCEECMGTMTVEDRSRLLDHMFAILDRMMDPGGVHDIQEQLGMVVNEPLEEVAV